MRFGSLLESRFAVSKCWIFDGITLWLSFPIQSGLFVGLYRSEHFESVYRSSAIFPRWNALRLCVLHSSLAASSY